VLYRILILTVLAAVCGVMWAADGPGLRIEITPLSLYHFRGQMMTNGPVLQSTATAAYRGAHAMVFTNVDLDRANQRPWTFDEVDLDAGYDYEREKITLSVGGIRYTFPNTELPSTAEVYGGIGFKTLLHPSVKVFRDVDAFQGTYITLDASQPVSLYRGNSGAKWEAVFSAGFGIGSARHNLAYYGVHQAGAADLHPTLTLPLTLGRWRLTPTLGYVTLLDGALRRGPVPHAHNVIAGIGLAFTL
jgi:hypothetical protein